jgi:hypothetical protein
MILPSPPAGPGQALASTICCSVTVSSELRGRGTGGCGRDHVGGIWLAGPTHQPVCAARLRPRLTSPLALLATPSQDAAHLDG